MSPSVTPTFSEPPAGSYTHRPGRYVHIGQTHWRHLAAVFETDFQSDQGDVVVILCANETRMPEEPFNFQDHLGPLGLVTVVFANDNSQLRRLLAFSVKQQQLCCMHIGLRCKVTGLISGDVVLIVNITVNIHRSQCNMVCVRPYHIHH